MSIPSKYFPRYDCVQESVAKGHQAKWSCNFADKKKDGTLVAWYNCAFCMEHSPQALFLSRQPYGSSLFTLIPPKLQLPTALRIQLMEKIASFPSEPIRLTDEFVAYPTFLYSAANRKWEQLQIEHTVLVAAPA